MVIGTHISKKKDIKNSSSCNQSKREDSRNLSSSNDLKADVLIIRTAGLPADIFPSKSWSSKSTSFHNVPKVAFKCLLKLSASWLRPSESPTMHESAHIKSHYAHYQQLHKGKISTSEKYSKCNSPTCFGKRTKV